MSQPVLYLVACGAPLATRTIDGIHTARERGWDVALISTAAASGWLDTDALPLDTTRLVTDQRGPDQAKRLPPADALAVVPMTFHTLNAWATGIANTYPLSVLCAALGAQTPAVAVPFAKHDLAGHPAWLASMAVLRYAGVTLIDPTSGAANQPEPVASGTGDTVAEQFRWTWVLDRLEG